MYRERTEIDVIEEQKWEVILGIPWMAQYNPEINWKIEEITIIRCPEDCRKQWRLVQEKLRWQKQKEEKEKKEAEKKQEEKKEKNKRKLKRKGIVEVKQLLEEQEIEDEKEKVARSEKKAKKLVLPRFYKWIKMLGKKASERMPVKKM